MISLTITRDELALSDLTIDSNPFGTAHHIPEEGVEWPHFPMRRFYAPPSRLTEGQSLLAAGRDLGVMPATIYAHGSTMAALMTAKAEIEAALAQSTYEVTLVVNGETVGTWRCDPDTPEWGELDSGMARAFIAKATVTFTLHPGVL